ncbi:hypothetical protein IKF03_00540 [Candidatus Saccharibacteria bacterium]|nr:hypothetical protein [Candidatus Saccharibacteria bacterium]
MNELFSPAKRIGELLAREFEKDERFYFFSPDETTSNKFDKIFEVEKRAWGMPTKTWDLPEGPDGRIVEMLSENVLFSVMSGHLMNGEKAMMGSYEAFFPIITAQILQQMKFIKQSKEVSWRKPIPAVNLLSTSVCWRQDHNGFTHQSPALISTLLSVPSGLANCLFPIDDISAEVAYDFMIDATNVVNLTTFDKNERPRYLDLTRAKAQLENSGAMVFEEFSDEEPDFILTAAGDIVAHEAIEAIKILKADAPDIKMRFVGLSALTYKAIGTVDNKLSQEKFDEMFTNDKPILANFHGFPETLEGILANYASNNRLKVHGFIEEGSTTTPFEMLRRNKASRYDLAIDVARVMGREDLILKYEAILAQNHFRAINYGTDLI